MYHGASGIGTIPKHTMATLKRGVYFLTNSSVFSSILFRLVICARTWQQHLPRPTGKPTNSHLGSPVLQTSEPNNTIGYAAHTRPLYSIGNGNTVL